MVGPCPNCSYENPIGANFCASCGAPQSVEDNTHQTELIQTVDAGSEAGLPQGVLVVRQGPKRGSRIALDADLISIGRHPESDIFLDDITVSRRHAEVHRSSEGFSVVDAGSLNGTYVNKDRVERSTLTDGAELQIGKFKLVYLSLEGDE